MVRWRAWEACYSSARWGCGWVNGAARRFAPGGRWGVAAGGASSASGVAEPVKGVDDPATSDNERRNPLLRQLSLTAIKSPKHKPAIISQVITLLDPLNDVTKRGRATTRSQHGTNNWICPD